MKRDIYLLLALSSSTLVYAAPATRGAITEGVFIVKNKHHHIGYAIGKFKQELTQCFVVKNMHESKLYHCKLKKMIYPNYIDELSRLLEKSRQDLYTLEKARSIDQALLDKFVQRAFLIDQKITMEQRYIEMLIELDGGPRLSKKKRQELAAVRQKIKAINVKLFTPDLEQDVFLERLLLHQELIKTLKKEDLG